MEDLKTVDCKNHWCFNSIVIKEGDKESDQECVDCFCERKSIEI